MQSKKCFAKVVPLDQDFDQEYGGTGLFFINSSWSHVLTSIKIFKGIFHFRFWLFGQWNDIVIDDRLPCYADGSLVFCSNKTEPNEMWGALLEKAYAKYDQTYFESNNKKKRHFFLDFMGLMKA